MKLQTLLEQASWRLRGYLGAPSTDARLVGWRRDSCGCPVAEWLMFEDDDDEDSAPATELSVDRDLVIWGNQMIPLPPILAHFIDLVDGEPRATFCGAWARVSRAQAETALRQAERYMAQHLLPMRAESIPRCEYCQDNQKCGEAAVGPTIYGFLDQSAQPQAKPQRWSCRLFLGRLCEEHWRRVIVAPASWWPSEVHHEAEVWVEAVR